MARGISSKLRGSIRVTSAAEEEMPGMPITLLPAKGSTLSKSLVRASAPEGMVLPVSGAWSWS